MIHHPAYRAWFNMINRVYGKNQGSYSDCSISKEWQRFSAFLSWWEANYKEGYQLDKDILYEGNREYGPKTCLYVPAQVNSMEAKRRNPRGSLPGVTFDKNLGKYKAQRESGKDRYLGYFTTPEEAHEAWLKDGGEERRDIWSAKLDEIRNQKSI